jgi:hypothetical protein
MLDARSVWRTYRAGAEPIARGGHRYQFRARARDALGNTSADVYSPSLLAVRRPVVTLGARLGDDALTLAGRAPRGRSVTVALRLRARGGTLVEIGRVRVKGRVRRHLALPTGLRDLRNARLLIRYRSRGRLRVKKVRVSSETTRFKLAL